jgi:hypothetical protein
MIGRGIDFFVNEEEEDNDDDDVDDDDEYDVEATEQKIFPRLFL